jgi:hypothetical protein
MHPLIVQTAEAPRLNRAGNAEPPRAVPLRRGGEGVHNHPSRLEASGSLPFLEFVEDAGSLLSVLFWCDLPVGEQPIDSR